MEVHTLLFKKQKNGIMFELNFLIECLQTSKM